MKVLLQLGNGGYCGTFQSRASTVHHMMHNDKSLHVAPQTLDNLITCFVESNELLS